MVARSTSPTLYSPSRSVSPSPSRRAVDTVKDPKASAENFEWQMQDAADARAQQGRGGSLENAEAKPADGKEASDDTTLAGKEGVRITEQEGKNPNEVGFDGDDDPYDPLRQPVWRKWMSVMTVSSGAICVTCASSMASSTYAGIEDSFGISNEVAILTVSLFVMGLGIGPLLLGPVSEFVGRRAVYLWSYVAFLLFTIPVAFANNAPVHLIFRFLCGFAGSAFLSVAGGTVADLFENDKLGTPMAIYSTSPFLGPVLGPCISGFINQNTTWRWTFYLLIAWSGVELGLIYFFAPETYKPQVLKIKAKHLRATTGNQDLYAPVERSDRSFVQTLSKSVKTPFIILGTQPMAVLLNLWTATLLGILYLFFNAFPITFMGEHGFNQQESGLSFLGIGLGQVIASACAPLWSRVYKKESAKHGGVAPPESRLLMGMAGAIATPIGLWIFAATATNTHWIAPILGSVPFGMGIVWTFSAVFTYLVDAYRPVAASAMASNSMMRSSLAAGFPLFARQMFSRLGTFGASALLAGLVTCMLPLPFVFYRIGGRIRERSKFGTGSKVADAEEKNGKA